LRPYHFDKNHRTITKKTILRGATMPELLTLTDSNLESVLKGNKPVLLLFSTGEGLRADFSTAYKKAAAENGKMIIAQIDPKQNPTAAEQLCAGDKPVLLGLLNGAEILRRSRPWGTDVPLAVEMMMNELSKVPVSVAAEIAEEETALDTLEALDETALVADGVPVKVTDETFQKEVIDYYLPVVVDFWAEWCGPCRQVAPILEKLAKEYAGKVRVAKVNVDENPGLSQTFQIRSIPLFMMIKQRSIVFSEPGAFPENVLRDLFNQLIALQIPAQEEPVEN